MVNQNILFALLFLCTYTVSGQTGDCSGAYIIDTKETFEFTIEADSNMLDEFLPTCIGGSNAINADGAFDTYWIGWKIKSSGTFIFELSKELDEYDIDFILYKSEDSSYPCNDLQPVRCMFSGETSGQASTPCISDTGLSFDEIDLFEDPGCNNMSNNYVKFVDAVEGELYRLIVLNFDGIQNAPIKIEFCGTALFGDSDEECGDINTTLNVTNKDIMIYPNPSYDLLSIKNLDSWSTNARIEILDLWGTSILKTNLTSNGIDISTFTPGMYYLSVSDGKSSSTTNFIKI